VSYWRFKASASACSTECSEPQNQEPMKNTPTTRSMFEQDWIAQGNPQESLRQAQDTQSYEQAAVEAAWRLWQRASAAQLERCASAMELSRSQILLMAGEMTAQEMRSVQAVLTNRARVIRSML
jgi:hypothetical protein